MLHISKCRQVEFQATILEVVNIGTKKKRESEVMTFLQNGTSNHCIGIPNAFLYNRSGYLRN